MMRRMLFLVAVLTVTIMLIDDAMGRGPRGGGGRRAAGGRAGAGQRGGVRSAPSIQRPTPADVGPGRNRGRGNVQRPAAGQSSGGGIGAAQGIEARPTTRGQLQDFLGRPTAGTGQRPGDRQLGGGDWRSQADQLSGDWKQSRDQVANQRQDSADQMRSQVQQNYNQRYDQDYDGNGDFSDWWDHMWDEHPAFAWQAVTSPVRWATWGAVAGWVGGSGGYYAEPVYYDYGYAATGDELVYVDGEPVASVDENAESAQALAQSAAATLEDNTATEIEWLPLGVYALAAAADDEAIMFLQLAVAKDGTLTGTYYNALTEQQSPVQGSVDPESQRAAFTIGDHSHTTLETGIVNLTEDHTPVLVHFGTDRTRTWFMVRLSATETVGAAAASAAIGNP